MDNRRQVRQQAQAQRKHDSKQWQIKKDDFPTAPLFGPPIRVSRKNDPETRRINDVLGNHANVHKYIQNTSNPSLIGVDRLPQTPASPFPKGNEHLFPVPLAKTQKRVEGSSKSSKERQSSSSNSSSVSKEHKSRRSRSRSKEKHGASDRKSTSHISRSQSLDSGSLVKPENKPSPDCRLSQESGYITGGSLETLNELETKNEESNKNNEKIPIGKDTKGSVDSGSPSKSKSVKSGHDPPDGNLKGKVRSDGTSNERKDAMRTLTPLKINQKKFEDGSGDNIDQILGEISLQPPLTAIQTPGKELPMSHIKIAEMKSQKSYSKSSSGQRSFRRVSSGGLATDLQVSSDSEDESSPNVSTQPNQERESGKSSGKKEKETKRTKKMSVNQRSQSESTDGSDDSDSGSDSAPGSHSDSSTSEDEQEKPEDKSNLSKNDSAGSGGLFDVPQDQPQEKPKFSYNLQEFKRKMITPNSVPPPDLTSPIKSQAETPDCADKCLQDILRGKCFDSGKLSPCPTLRNGAEGETHEDLMDTTHETSHFEELKVTSTSGSCKSNSKGFLSDIHQAQAFGIAQINQADDTSGDKEDDEDEEIKKIHQSKPFSPQHSPFKPIIKSPPNQDGSSKNSRSNNKLKPGSSIENIPDSEIKDKRSNSQSKSKSKRSQSSSDKSNQKASVKQDSRHSRTSSKSPSRNASKIDKKSSSSSANGGTQKKGRRLSGKSTKTLKPKSKEFLSSDSSEAELSGPENTPNSYVDIEGLSSPEKDKSAMKSSSPKPGKSGNKLSELNHETSSPIIKSEHNNKKNKTSESIKTKHKTKQKDKSDLLIKANRNTSSNSSLDLSHILEDVCAPDELLSPVPNIPNLVKQGKILDEKKLPVKKSTPKRHSIHVKEEVHADSTVATDATLAQNFELKPKDLNASVPTKSTIKFINGLPSIMVSIDLNLLTLSSRTAYNHGSSANEHVKSHHFMKGDENIFQNIAKGLTLNLHEIGYLLDSQQPSTATITPDIVPSDLFPESDNDHNDNTADTDTFTTNSASQIYKETVESFDTGSEPPRTERPKKPELVDVSQIIDLEGVPPPAMKIPKKRRQGDSSSSERIKKPRTEDRLYRDRGHSPYRGVDSPQYNKRLSDYDRRGSRERYISKRSRLEDPALQDECSRSPSTVRESPRWSTPGSDYRRTSRCEDYSDRESIHLDDDQWDHSKDRLEATEHGSSLASHNPSHDIRRGNRYDRDKWRERDRVRRERERYDRDRQKMRTYSRDWDAPSDDQFPESHSPAYPHPTSSSYRPRGVADQWSDVVAGNVQPYRDRRERIYEEEKPSNHYRRNKVAPVNEKLESANHYLEEAKKLKHNADKIKEKKAKMVIYVDAFLSFIQCGYAMEQENVSGPTKICKMYQDTLKLIRYCMVGHDGSDKPDNIMIKKLSVFSFRIQSVLCLRLYKLKKSDIAKLKRIIDDHNKSTNNSKPSVQAPSPYSHTSSTTQSSSGNGNSGWKGTSGTPSPMSPQPSPAGSVGSVGSVGSGEHPKMVNGNVSSTTICVNQRIHSVTQEYLKNMDCLYQCHEAWDQADHNMEDKDFFASLDRDCGNLSLQSSVPELVRYIKEGLSRLKAT